MPARVPGRRGRLPAKRLDMGYIHEYAAGGALPPPVYPVDVSASITDWGMLANGPDPSCTTHPDGVGDCTFAARQHLRMAKAAAFGEHEQWETSNQLVAEYLAYDHGQDQGAVIADLLMYWYKTGRILAFAPVDHKDPAQVDAAMAAFHGAYCGVSLTDDADQLFSEGEPWTLALGQRPDPSQGHCIIKVGAYGPGARDEWVTWGATQASTPAWTAACLDEAFVLITSEDEAARAGVDLIALRADINALHGTGGHAAPKPPKIPVPQQDNMLRELAALVRTVAASVDRDISEVVAWLGSRGL